MKRGLTLGKYAPFHRGHQLVVETALAEMDETIVIAYDAPETTDVPLEVRAGWIRSLYPSARVVEARNGPVEVGYTPEIMGAHEQYVIERLGIEGVTHFYSSEPYGDHMSRALGAIDRRVDTDRRAFPVSGTDIRADTYSNREFVSPVVYRDLITNVVFLGAPCTGKTSLAESLSREFSTQWMPEFGREYWEAHQVERRLTLSELVEVAEGHLEREDSLVLRSNRYIFTDTNALTTAVFARWYHGEVPSRLANLADRAESRYDLVFLCSADIPYVDTWDRSGETNRTAFQRLVIEDLRARGVPFVELSGTLNERISRVREVLDGFSKYPAARPACSCTGP